MAPEQRNSFIAQSLPLIRRQFCLIHAVCLGHGIFHPEAVFFFYLSVLGTGDTSAKCDVPRYLSTRRDESSLRLNRGMRPIGFSTSAVWCRGRGRSSIIDEKNINHHVLLVPVVGSIPGKERRKALE